MSGAPIGAREISAELREARADFVRGFLGAFRAPSGGASRLRKSLGFPRSVLTVQTAKLEHSSMAGAILYFSPARSSGIGVNLCPNASGCVAPCLAEQSGRMHFPAARAARARRTKALLEAPVSLGAIVGAEARALVERARDGRAMLRLDGGSDLGIGLEIFAELDPVERTRLVLFDYTKSLERAVCAAARGYPIAFSVTRRTLEPARALLTEAHAPSLSVVVDAPRGAMLPGSIGGARCIDGDRTGEDWATLAPREREGSLILLRFKGSRGARLDAARRAGFVFNVDELGAVLA